MRLSMNTKIIAFHQLLINKSHQLILFWDTWIYNNYYSYLEHSYLQKNWPKLVQIGIAEDILVHYLEAPNTSLR